MTIKLIFPLLAISTLAAAEPADLRTRKTGVDWPTFLGPTRDGVSAETGILKKWPRDGLKVVWETTVGLGYAPPVVARGRLFHFDRFGDDGRLTCRHAETGKFLWKYEYPTAYDDLYGYSPGPRACPVVDGDRVYLHGADGFLACLAVEDGKLLWKVDTQKEFHFHQNHFGVGSVPVVEGELLIVAVGGSAKGPRPSDLREARGNGSGLVAFDKVTGKVVWKSTDELASYASPVIREIGGQRLCVYFARDGLVAVDPKTGKPAWRFPWRAKILESVNASNPVFHGDEVLITECYGPGSALVRIKDGKASAVWTDAEKDREDKSLRCHWNTPIRVGDFVYGSSGRHENEGDLRCVEWSTGRVVWQEPRLGRTSLTLVDGHFLCQCESGDLLLVKVNPEKYELVAKWRTDLDFPAWAAPVVSNGYLYIRGKDRLICADLSPGK